MTTLLEQSNQDWHQRLEQQFKQFMLALTALDLEQTMQAWQTYKTTLQLHLELEDQAVLPLATALDDNKPTLINADHTILQRLISRIDPALEALQQTDSPHEMMVEQLDGYLKMRNVLTHHDLREVQEFYPALVATLSQTQIEQLGEKMAAGLAALNDD